MRYIMLAVCFISLSGCQRTPEQLILDIKKLEMAEAAKKADIQILQNTLNQLSSTRDQLNSQIDEDKLKIHIQEGGKVRYIFKMKLSQDRVGLPDLKDLMNAVEFEMDVGRDYYYRYNNGDAILKEFRKGSAVMEDSYSAWLIELKSKRIEMVNSEQP